MQRDPQGGTQGESGRHGIGDFAFAALISGLMPAAISAYLAYAFSPYLFRLVPDLSAALNSTLGLQLSEATYQRVFAGLVAVLVFVTQAFAVRKKDRVSTERKALFERLAASLRGRVETANTEKTLTDALEGFFGANGWVSTEQVLWIERADARIAIADIQYWTQGGTRRQRRTQTIAYLQSKRLRYPGFMLQPATRMTDLLDATTGSEDLDFPAHPEFSARYHLSAVREDNARLLFDEVLLAELGSHEHLHIRSHDGKIVLYRDDVIVEDAELPRFADAAIRILGAFDEAGRRAQLSVNPVAAGAVDVKATVANMRGPLGSMARKSLVTRADLDAFLALAPPRATPPAIYRQALGALGDFFIPMMLGILSLIALMANVIALTEGPVARSVFAGGFVLILVAWFYYLRARHRVRKLLRNGALVRADILQIEPTNFADGGGEVRRLVLRFRAGSESIETVCRIRGEAVNRAQTLLDKGKRATVLYDPAAPHRVVYADSLLMVSLEYEL